jgi:hypothetical protein
MSQGSGGKSGWDMPLGFIGLGAMAIVGGVAFTLGEFNFYGLEFLAYWRLMGWPVEMSVFAAVWVAFVEWAIWNGRGFGFLASSRSLYAVAVPAAVLAALAIAYWSLHQHYQCLLLRAPVLGLVIFAIACWSQAPIVITLRNLGHYGAAFAALLIVEAGFMFLIGELLAVDHYRKGLAHFENENRAEWSISTSSGADFHFDYAQKETVLKTHVSGADPVEIRRSFGGFCARDAGSAL